LALCAIALTGRRRRAGGAALTVAGRRLKNRAGAATSAGMATLIATIACGLWALAMLLPVLRAAWRHSQPGLLEQRRCSAVRKQGNA